MDKFISSRMMLRHWHILLVILFTFLLSSCSHVVHHGDGPPNFYVDETKIPNAKPKHEKLAKHGNMPFYHVKGARYYTMKSAKGYEQVGVASWYGTLFHAQRTSSGERYDMLGMTAAHKTLPLPTYVEVTNLKNNRKIIVKVNDRGPFKPNRIIDLSYVAAKKLGMAGRGTALVKVKAIDPSTYGQPRARHMYADNHRQHTFSSNKHHHLYADAKHTKNMYMQVGTFHNRVPAERLRARLLVALDAPVRISSVKLSKANVYKVHIGPIKDVATANRINQRLRVMGLK